MATDFATPEPLPVHRLPLCACSFEDLECRKVSVQNLALVAIKCENVRSMHFNLVHLTLNCAKTSTIGGHAPDREKLLSKVLHAIAIAEARQVVEIESQAI